MSVPPTKITGVSGFYKGRIATFQHPLITIGRSQGSGLSFPLDLTVSREHALIRFAESEWTVRDLGSSNGTFLNGRRLTPGETYRMHSADELRCGQQIFRLEWAPVIQNTSPVVPLRPVEPVAVQPGHMPPPAAKHVIPPPPPKQDFSESTTQTSYRWVEVGERIEVQERVITAGLFYFGKSMKAKDGYNREPSLIEASQVATKGSIGSQEAILNFTLSYRSCTRNQRAEYLDWLAAGRPPETMPEEGGLLFLAGIERRQSQEVARSGNVLAPLTAELKRLIRGAPPASRAAAQMRQFLIYTGSEPLVSDKVPMSESELDELRFGELSPSLALRLASRISAGQPLNAVEALMATAADSESYPRTPFFRCPQQVLQVFETRYSQEYPDSIRPRLLNRPINLTYQPANGYMYSQVVQRNDVRDYHISTEIIGRLRQFLTEATDALDAYSRRLASRRHEADRLPAIALLPKALAEAHPAIRQLAEVVARAKQPDGRLSLGEVAKFWTDWPADGPLARVDRELLRRTFWFGGMLMEPSSTAGTLDSKGVVYIAPRGPKSNLEPSLAFEAAAPLAAIAAIVVTADGRTSESERSHVKDRLLALCSLADDDAVRLELYLNWILDQGVPKISRKSIESLEPSLRRPFLGFLAEVAAVDGYVSPHEVKEIVRIAKLLGVNEEEVYGSLHAVQARKRDPNSIPGAESPRQGLDMQMVARKLASSKAAAEILETVFVEEDAPSSVEKIEFSARAASKETDALTQIVMELLTREVWTRADFSTIVRSHHMLPAATYDDLNEAALDAVGDPLLEGEDPINVAFEVGRVLLG